MPTSRECRYYAKECLELASVSPDVFVKIALAELAEEFNEVAGRLEKRPRAAGAW
jgi:hypothetical protein